MSVAPFPMAKCQVTKVSGLLKSSEKLISLSSLVLYSWRAKFYFRVSCHGDQRLLTRGLKGSCLLCFNFSSGQHGECSEACGFLEPPYRGLLVGQQMKGLGNNLEGSNSERAFLRLQWVRRRGQGEKLVTHYPPRSCQTQPKANRKLGAQISRGGQYQGGDWGERSAPGRGLAPRGFHKS